MIEKSNYHAVIRHLDELNNSNMGIIVCAINVTGKLSAADIGRLINKFRGEEIILFA